MTVQRDESLIRDLARPLVTAIAPAEKDLFEMLSDAHFARPGGYANVDRDTGPLAFGLPEFTVLLTPIMLAAMTESVEYVVARLMTTGTKVTAREIRRLFAAARRTPAANPESASAPADASIPVSAPADASISLTPREWAEVHRIVETVARRGGVVADQARLIADAAVAQGILDEATGDC
jgi:hypothetical protein